MASFFRDTVYIAYIQLTYRAESNRKYKNRINKKADDYEKEIFKKQYCTVIHEDSPGSPESISDPLREGFGFKPEMKG